MEPSQQYIPVMTSINVLKMLLVS
ncbi:hypothetical protein CBM2608_A10100 [Cupriavidus taiwanensis]|nr:hypothetical protein CBM2608_A10100 [Cupriavidus taiwanensis]